MNGMDHRRLQILVLTPRFPYPPHDGFNVRVWNLYRYAARRYPHTVVSVDSIGSARPRVKNPEAAARLTLWAAAEGDHQAVSPWRKLRFALRGYPIWSCGMYAEKVEMAIRRTVAIHRYDVIVLESSWMGVYWPAVASARALKILDMHDLEGEKIRRQARLMTPGREKLKYLINAFQFKLLENRLLHRVDRVFVTSRREYAKLKSIHPDADIHVVPNGVDCESIMPLPTATASRDILFVGRLGYYPNQDGVLYFAREILPLLRRRFSNVRFWVVGGEVTPEVLELNHRKGIRITGQVEDLKPYYERCAACVVPLRAGSGTRLKILEAMAYGRPVVSTTLGCEGLGTTDGQHLLVADTPQAFSAALGRLFQDPATANRLVGNARRFIEAHYCWQAIAENVSQLYQR